MENSADFPLKTKNKDKHHMISHIESKKEFFKRIYMNLFAEQKQTHKLRKQIYGYQRGQVRGRDGLGVWD